MNQTMRVIIATILVALNFTHPSNADAQQKFSFQGVSYNGDIKPKQFSFSDVSIKARSNTDRVNIKVIFQDVSTPYKATDKDETVAITFEGDPKSETVYAVRLDYGTFFQTIPRKFSLEGRENRHLISITSVKDGSFNTLYEQLTNDDKVKIKGACNYFMDDINIDKITSLKSPLGESIVSKSTKRVDKLLSATNISNQIKALATLCFQATNRVYVKDIQTFLNASGYDVGKSDGQWGKKSQKGWEAYLTSQGKPLDTTIDATSIQELQKSIISKIPKLREITFNDDYFDTKHEIRNHKEHTYGNLCKFIGCPAMIIKKNQIRKVVKDNRNKAFQHSKYIKAITKEQWNIIENIGDPQNCFARLSLVDKIKLGAVINPKIYAQNKNYIKQTLNKNKTVFLENGIFQLDETINLDGKILIGSEKTILDASLLETGVIVSNGTLKNVRIINAKKIGVSVIKNSNLHNVIIENTGVGVEDNSKGHGVSILGENSTGNCLVSVEAYNGYNKAGDNCCKNGGNADGFQIKYGANGVTLVDTHGHHNSDDGFDLWKSGHDAPIKKEDIIIRFYYSSANLNGKNPLTPDGDGNGFKLGSRDKYQAPKKDKGARLIYGSVACYNKLNGFDRNGTKMKIFAGRLQASGNGAEQFRDITRYMNTPADPYTLKCKMFPRN
tara:strand:+ start:161 stop:2167 length:2007 start_codon:yes stop_codon:yes gene_type:complete